MCINSNWCRDFSRTNPNLRTSVTTKVTRTQTNSSSNSSTIMECHNKSTNLSTREWNQRRTKVKIQEPLKMLPEVLEINSITNSCFQSWIKSALSNNKLKIKPNYKNRITRLMTKTINSRTLWVKQFLSNHSKYRTWTKVATQRCHNSRALLNQMTWTIIKHKMPTRS